MKNNKNKYDVVIIGGGTSGCACAWNCSKLGMKTLLVEKNNFLGGAITAQLVIPAMKTDDNNFNTDFYNGLCDKLHADNAQIEYIDGNKGWFNPFKTATTIYNMLKEVGCDIKLNSTIYVENKNACIDTNYIDKKICGDRILSLYIISKYIDNKNTSLYNETTYNDNIAADKYTKKEKIHSKYFVDATGDANLCELLGATFLPKENTQAMSLRFVMSNIDKKSFAQWLLSYDKDRNVTTAGEIDGQIHLSTAYTWDIGQKWALKPLFDEAVKNGTLKDSDRAYFQVFSIAGEDDKIAFNCPRIISEKELNPLDINDKITAKSTATKAIERLADFCKKYLIGFENAKIYKIADELGIRESRRVKGKYILKKEDIYKAKKFENPVAYSNYPIDVHSIKKDNSVLNYMQKTYSVPLESLIVDGFENLFVIGRCISADFYAQAAIRIQPTCFAMGEGLAKHLNLL